MGPGVGDNVGFKVVGPDVGDNVGLKVVGTVGDNVGFKVVGTAVGDNVAVQESHRTGQAVLIEGTSQNCAVPAVHMFGSSGLPPHVFVTVGARVGIGVDTHVLQSAGHSI